MLMLMTLLVVPAGVTHVAPGAEGLEIVGRYVDTGGAAEFDWAGTEVRLQVASPSLRVLLDGTGPDFNVRIDGEPFTVLQTWGAPSYELFLPDAEPHTVTLTRRQGPAWGVTRLLGVALPAGGRLLPMPDPDKLVEFVGDSLTVGYGVEAQVPACEGLRPYENASKSYASVAAARLGVDAHLVAASGHGLVRNWGEPAPSSAEAMSTLYRRTVRSRVGDWTPARRADAVVVRLGANDYSPGPAPDAEQIARGYLGLLTSIRALHGEYVPIFVLGDPMYVDARNAAWATAQASHAAGHQEVHFVELPRPGEDVGCDGHPGERSQRLAGEALAAAMRDKLGW